jgi:hypothetical protein
VKQQHPGRPGPRVIALARFNRPKSDVYNTTSKKDRFREEAVMSIAHRPFSAGLGRGRDTTSAPKSHPLGWGQAEKPEPGTHEREGNMTSYPWEGLYLEVHEISASTAAAAPEPYTPLGAFLTSLMYGE